MSEATFLQTAQQNTILLTGSHLVISSHRKKTTLLTLLLGLPSLLPAKMQGTTFPYKVSLQNNPAQALQAIALTTENHSTISQSGTSWWSPSCPCSATAVSLSSLSSQSPGKRCLSMTSSSSSALPCPSKAVQRASLFLKCHWHCAQSHQ